MQFLMLFMSQISKHFNKLPNQHQACLYSFECNSLDESKFTNEIDIFWYFLQVLSNIWLVVCSDPSHVWCHRILMLNILTGICCWYNSNYSLIYMVQSSLSCMKWTLAMWEGMSLNEIMDGWGILTEIDIRPC